MDSHQILAWAVQGVIGIGIAGSVVFCCLGYLGARRFRHRAEADASRKRAVAGARGVSILKPLKGLDVDLYENLATFCCQEYATFQILFGVADADDPAVPVVHRLQADYPAVRIDLVVDGRMYGTNHKVSNLHNMYRAAVHDIVVIADSDIRVGPDYLHRIVPELDDPEVGVVTCLYRAVSTGGAPTLCETLFINTDFAPMVLVAGIIEKPTYAFGATMALRRSTLDEIGGFLPLVSYLADDYHLGHRVAARGYRLALSTLVVETVLAVGSWKRLLDHQVRWARTYRSCRPGGYFTSILTHGTLWATINLLYHGFSPPACALAAMVYGLRIAVASTIDDTCLGASLPLRHALLVPIKDLFVSAIWVLAFLGDTVHWSGHEFRVLKDGRMVHVDAYGGVIPEPVYPQPEEPDRHPASI